MIRTLLTGLAAARSTRAIARIAISGTDSITALTGCSRAAKMPPMRDRQTRARHVRGYVTQGKTDSYGTPTAKYATTSQRKALATMGRRGGKKAAQRGNRP